jgi:hypothetical protein
MTDYLDDTTEAPTDADPLDLDDDLNDLTESDYATAARQLADEATQAQDGSTEAEPDSTPREQRYRQRAQTAEAERDRLSAVVDGMRRSEVERVASARLADPGDLFRDGATLADVLDAEGAVDPARVDALIDKVIDGHPHWRAPAAPYRGPLHSGATNTRRVDAPSKGFADAFTPKTE